MPSKTKTIFVCKECGNETSRWEGQCRGCGEWNTLVEAEVITGTKSSSAGQSIGSSSKPSKLSDVSADSFKRINTGIEEFDRTIGGGLVAGQVTLLGGDPGIGKSTILLQLASEFKAQILYATGEESEPQVALRARRLGLDVNNIDVISTGDIDSILNNFMHDLLIVDSIQVMSTSQINSASGSVTQVRECAARIVNFAKSKNIPAIIVGHITKEGNIAGPKILEHMVDTVLYLEGDRQHLFRLLRVNKNRFGDDAEVGIFTMDASGLKAVPNPGEMLINTGSLNTAGSAVAIVLEGSRPLAVEVQALTTKTSFGYPKRASSGFSLSRLQLLCAVLQKHMKINLTDQDIYLNIASGLSIKEPAIDLAVCAAIISSFKESSIKPKTAFFGEVGLSGELRNVVAAERRVKEASRLGFKNILYTKNIKNINEILKSLI